MDDRSRHDDFVDTLKYAVRTEKEPTMERKGKFVQGRFVPPEDLLRLKCVAKINYDGSVAYVEEWMSYDAGVTWTRRR